MSGLTRREILLFVATLIAALVVLVLLGGGVLWTRPFWMDEAATYFLTTEPSLAAMLRLVAAGGDWNPPALHLGIRAAMALTFVDAPTPVFMHSFSLVCVSGALLLTYAALRRRFSVAAGVAGVLALAAHSLVVEHAFEGRFYGPWLFFAVGVAWSLGVDADAIRSRRRDIAIAAFAVLLVAIHWYGVVSLALLCAGAVAASDRPIRERLRLIAPAGIGLIVFVAMFPLALAQRRSAASVLWVPPLDVAQVFHVAGEIAPAAAVMALAVALLLGAFRTNQAEGNGMTARVSGASSSADGPAPGGGRGANAGAAFRDPGIGALMALAIMPLALVALSLLVTPSMIARYAIVATLVWAPLVAVAVDALGRRWLRFAAIGALSVFLVTQVHAAVVRQRQYSRVVALNEEAFERARALGVPILFQRLHLMYATAATHRSRGPAGFLDLPDSTIHALYPANEAEPLRNAFRLERDQARYHARIFGWPAMMSLAALDTAPRFAIVATDVSLPSDYRPIGRYAARLFPNHHATRVSPALTVLERAASPTQGTAAR